MIIWWCDGSLQVWRWLPTSWISAVFCRISAAYTEVLSSQKWGQRPCANCCRRLGVGTCPVLYIVMVMSAWPWLWCGHYFRTIVRVHPVYMTKMWLSILRLLIACESACSHHWCLQPPLPFTIICLTFIMCDCDWPFTWLTDQLLSFSAWHCWLGHLTRKNRLRYDL